VTNFGGNRKYKILRKSSLREWFFSLQTEGQPIALQLEVALRNRFAKAPKSCLRTSQNNTLSSLYCARSLSVFHSRPACITSPMASGRRYVWVALQNCVGLLSIRSEAFWGTQPCRVSGFRNFWKFVVCIIRDRTVIQKTSLHLHTVKSPNYIHRIILIVVPPCILISTNYFLQRLHCLLKYKILPFVFKCFT
jgi:hypothetical protein